MKIDNMNETNIPTNKSDRTQEQEATMHQLRLVQE